MSTLNIPMTAKIVGHLVPVTLHYRRKFPWEIELQIETSRQVVRWSLSRELVLESLQGGVTGRDYGQGDVKLATIGGQFRVWLRSPTGEVVIWLLLSEVEEAVRSTYLMVPDFQEEKHMDWSGLDKILAEGASS